MGGRADLLLREASRHRVLKQIVGAFCYNSRLKTTNPSRDWLGLGGSCWRDFLAHQDIVTDGLLDHVQVESETQVVLNIVTFTALSFPGDSLRPRHGLYLLESNPCDKDRP